MNKMFSIAVLTGVITLSGCSYATQKDVTVLSSKVELLGGKLDVVTSKVNETDKLARRALESATSAQAAGDAAQGCCAEQKSRLDSMFEKAMRK
jgi:hypothetical protein